MKEILDNYGLYILIGLGVIVIIVAIIIIITSKKKSNEIEENSSSIFDVNIEGVVNKDFNYGYSKEDTVVVKPEELKERRTKSRKK